MPDPVESHPTDAQALLNRLLAEGEQETVEFKAAATQYDRNKLGQYTSALSNEANLAGHASAWFVMGVSDDGTVSGTAAFNSRDKINALKLYLQEGTDPSFTVRNVIEVEREGQRVLLLEIPAAPQGMPISWQGIHYSRAGESLKPLTLDKLDAIRAAGPHSDWTNELSPTATLGDLDLEALQRARQGFMERHATRLSAEEVTAWSDEDFLIRTRLMRDGFLTRAALLLLGGPTASAHLDHHPAQLTWDLRGEQLAYEHFYPPLLLTAGDLVSRIRNVKLRIMPPNELIYREVSKYEEQSLLEALYNCIAHQDYTQHARVVVVEHADRLELTSVGRFFDGVPDDYMTDAARTPRRYRNAALARAMQTFNLVDQMGYGIHRMVDAQVRRFMPLPDYDLSRPDEVTLTLHGVVIDKRFSQALMARSDLAFEDILALDRVQKGQEISPEAARRLRRESLIEGRRPKLRIAPQVATARGDLADYIRTRPQSDTHYMTLVQDYLERQGHADRRGLDALLRPLLSDALTEEQKTNKVSNLLGRLRRQGWIHNAGSRSQPRWVLSDLSSQTDPSMEGMKEPDQSDAPETA